MNECALLISIFNLSTLTAIPRRVPGTPMGLTFGLAGGGGGTGLLCVGGDGRPDKHPAHHHPFTHSNSPYKEQTGVSARLPV